MPASRQFPLTAPRGMSEHDFSLSADDAVVAIFDAADHFAVVDYRLRPREYETFRELPQALARVRANRGCLYAVTATGHSMLLDREKWDEWLMRWNEDRKSQNGV